jgi:hypothetical protein
MEVMIEIIVVIVNDVDNYDVGGDNDDSYDDGGGDDDCIRASTNGSSTLHHR